MNKHLASLYCSVLPLLTVFAQGSADLLDASTRELLHESLSGELAKEHVIQITRHHRIQGSRGYRDAAQYVLQQLRRYGFSEKDAYIESFKSDGRITYQTWQSPSGWDISWAELRMIEPYEERIVGYPEVAMSTITYSNPGDVTSELVWVGSGTQDKDYAGKHLLGKIALATGYGGDVHRLAVLKHGARGVVCYLDDDRAREYPDMLQYTGMWPRTDELERVTFGFNLTNRQGTKLRDLLLDGKRVVVRGQVKGIGLEPYFMDVVVAHIRGSMYPTEELVFSAHLDHPKESANDNASGSAAILDIARSLQELIGNGRLSGPKRSFRFLWVPEWYGTMAYIDAHPEMTGPLLGGTFLANMNLDMVGENVELLHSKLVLTRTPHSIPSAVNDVVENMASMVNRIEIRTPRGSQSVFNYRVIPYSGGSDHMMFIDRKIPGIMFSHDPDYTHHTSEDTPDKVDPVELERCEIIAAGSLWYLANLDSLQALDLAYLIRANARRRLGETARYVQQSVARAAGGALSTAWVEAINAVDHMTQQETDVLASIVHFNGANNVKEVIERMKQQVRHDRTDILKELSAAANQPLSDPAGDELFVFLPPVLEKKPDKRVPVRLTRGPLDFDLPASSLRGAYSLWYSSPDFILTADERFELVNFIDGRYTVSEIRHALSAEFRPIETRIVARYITDLIQAGVARWK